MKIKPPKYLPGTIVYVVNPEDEKEIACVRVVGAVLNKELNKWEYFFGEQQDEGYPEDKIIKDIEAFNK
jgi:hypothetical protein